MSAAWYELPDGDPSKEAARDAWHAACWRKLVSSPHIGALIGEWIEWNERNVIRNASWGVSEVFVYRSNWVTYAEIERRRNEYDNPPLTPDQIKAQALASWAELDPRKGAA